MTEQTNQNDETTEQENQTLTNEGQEGQDDGLLNINGAQKPTQEGEPSEDEPKKKPADLAEQFWDSEKGEVKIDELAKAYKGLRDKMAKGLDKAPEKADDYKVTFDDGINVADDDEVLAKAKIAAKAAGISNEQFGKLANAFMKETGGVFLPPTAPTDEEKAQYRKAEMEKIGPNAPAIVRGISSWINSNKLNGVFDENDVYVCQDIGSTAEGVKFLNKLRAITGESDIPAVNNFDDGVPSDAEILSIMRSDAYKKGDANTVSKVAEYMERRIKVGRPERLQA
jgi:hypothetical protein